MLTKRRRRDQSLNVKVHFSSSHFLKEINVVNVSVIARSFLHVEIARHDHLVIHSFLRDSSIDAIESVSTVIHRVEVLCKQSQMLSCF